MKTSMKITNAIRLLIIPIIGFLSILSGAFICPLNRFISGLIIILAGLILYFLMVFRVVEKNWLDIRAVFTGVWLVTIGLAAFRLTNYQEPWLTKTWVLLAIAYLMFQIGALCGISQGGKVFSFLQKVFYRLKPKRIQCTLSENKLFPICVVITLIGIVCFVINALIKGYIPAFSNVRTAYVDFYTKFHLFAVGATAVSGLCYYCIKTQPISKMKKAILWGCIFYLIILFPTLVVSRGVFIIAALSFSTVFFYLNKRKLSAFIICLVVMMSMYLITSSLRGYSDAELDNLFDPSEIVLDDDENGGEGGFSFSLPPKAAFLYGYLTVSHDNFNEAVENTKGYTWGVRQLAPFNVILRMPWINETIENGEFYMVRPYLTTVNMVGLFYYDFHAFGVAICTLLWAILVGIVQGVYEKAKGPFSLFILGFAMNVVALSFFSSWVDAFELWMFCGVIFIVAVIASVKIKRKE